MAYFIEKSSKNIDAYKRKYEVFPRARDGFGELLDYIGVGVDDSILLPGYIGWSEREGSGVFDPIRERNISPVFYHLKKTMQMDVEDLKEKIMHSNVKALVFIHYFGFVDESVLNLSDLARKKGIIVIEDAAHALFSDRVGLSCGRYGDYTLYSLHKMLPMQTGGMLVSSGERSLPRSKSDYKLECDLLEYDLNNIAKARIENYNRILEELRNISDDNIIILYPRLEKGIVPQTFPVLLKNSDRDKVYFKMNDLGWGVVSLYHTMIQELQKEEYEAECNIAKRIINLPVHQDVNMELIHEMVTDFIRIVRECKI